MDKKIGRRDFIKGGIALGMISAANVRGRDEGSSPGAQAAVSPDLAAVSGPDYGANAAKAVALLGGMGAFIRKGAKVALLPNSQSRHPGTFTHPAVVRSVIRMCHEAGASEIDCLSWLDAKNWAGTGLEKAIAEEGARLVLVERKEENFRSVPVPRGVALKEVRIMNELYRHDVLIDMPIAKDHSGNRFTGTLKNLMGLSSPESNNGFHKDDADPEAVPFLDQCIADLNTVIAPALCVVDATEYIVTNGPFGPGEILKSRTVVAGTDRVAVDAFCVSLRGIKPEEIIMIRKAHEHGLGEIDLSKVKIIKTEA